MARPTRHLNVGESLPFPSLSAHCYNSSPILGDMPERRRTHSLWRSAISATKGFFSASSAANSVQQDEYKEILAQLPSPSAFPQSFGDKQSVAPTHAKQSSISQTVRKCRSTPSFKNSNCNAQVKLFTSGTTSTSHETELPPIPTSRSAASTFRPLISSPTLPRRMESFDIQSFANNDLIPNELGSISDCRFLPITSGMKSNASASGDLETMISASHRYGNNLLDSSRTIYRSNSERRRSESAPGLNANDDFLHPGKILHSNVKRATSRPQLRPSPSFSSGSSQNSSAVASPLSAFSPKPISAVTGSPAHSISSVKRKPVPRFLEPPEYNPSAPTSPSSQGHTFLHTPLFPSTVLIMGAMSSRLSPKDITLMPIGPNSRKTRSDGINENVDEVADTAENVSLALPMYEDSYSATHALTPPPPRPRQAVKHTMDTPPSSRSGALSPLTIDDLDAMRTFLSQHETGIVARQHRKKSLPVDEHYNDLPTEILQSYLDIDLSPLSDDSSSHRTSSSSSIRDDEEDRRSLITIATRDDPEVETPVNAVSGADVDSHIHRGTFGCYGLGISVCEEQYVKWLSGDESYYEGMSDVLRSLHADEQQEHNDEDYIEGPDPEYTFPARKEESPVATKPLNMEQNKRYTLLDARVVPQVLVIPPRKSSLPAANSSPRHLIGRPIAQFDFHEGNSDSMGNIDPGLESMTGATASPIDRLHESLTKLKTHSPSLTSTSSFLEPALPIFRHNNYSSDFESDELTPTRARSRHCYDAHNNDYDGGRHYGKFSHMHYSDSSSTDEFEGGTVTPPLAMSSFMDVSPEEAPSPPQRWPRKTHKRLRCLFSRASVLPSSSRITKAH